MVDADAARVPRRSWRTRCPGTRGRRRSAWRGHPWPNRPSRRSRFGRCCPWRSCHVRPGTAQQQDPPVVDTRGRQPPPRRPRRHQSRPRAAPTTTVTARASATRGRPGHAPPNPHGRRLPGSRAATTVPRSHHLLTTRRLQCWQHATTLGPLTDAGRPRARSRRHIDENTCHAAGAPRGQRRRDRRARDGQRPPLLDVGRVHARRRRLLRFADVARGVGNASSGSTSSPARSPSCSWSRCWHHR